MRANSKATPVCFWHVLTGASESSHFHLDATHGEAAIGVLGTASFEPGRRGAGSTRGAGQSIVGESSVGETKAGTHGPVVLGILSFPDMVMLSFPDMVILSFVEGCAAAAVPAPAP